MDKDQADMIRRAMVVSSIVSLFRTDDTDTESYVEGSISVSGLVELPMDLREILKELGVIVDDDGRCLIIPLIR